MKNKKDETIRTRCTSDLKSALQEIVDKHNYKDISTLSRSILSAYVTTSQTADISFTEQVQRNIFRDSVLNIINISPAIPDEVKDKLNKEILSLW